MIMYFVATGKQPFADCAHGEILALNICNGIRPEISELEAPKCYIDLMKKCWDSIPDDRPNAIETKELIDSFYYSLNQNSGEKEQQQNEIEKQFEKAQEHRKANPISIKNNQLATHTQAVYTSRLFNPFIKDPLKYDDNINNNTVEITDLTK